MRTEAKLTEWKDLYEIAIKIKSLKPWERLYSMDLITIIDKDKEECICSIMGKNGEFYGVGVYVGEDSIKDFYEMSFNEGMPPHQLIRYQNNIMCNYGNRDELTTKELEIIKDLGLKFRGKDNWIYFRTFEKGYVPYMPNREEVLKMTKILNDLYDALNKLDNGLKVDFENEKTLMHRFDSKNNKWISSEEDLIIPDMDYDVPVLQDDLLIKKLKKQKQDNTILELDIAYLNSIVNDKEYEKPINTKILILVEAESGLVLGQQLLKPNYQEVNFVYDIIINYVIQAGRPNQIVVRDSYMASLIMDLCERINIEIIISSKLHGIDEVMESFYQFRL